jgi:4-aminobutyrate aminotransferase-like enzyme/Ser/Thr protein kinase RdoA (MazF antagonist)
MSLVQHAPRFEPRDAERLAQTLYGVTGDATPLPSERDQNFLVRCADGRSYVLKMANALEARELLEAQNRALEYIAGHATHELAPQPVRAQQDELISLTQDAAGISHFVRLLTFVPGQPLAQVRPHNPVLLASLGRFMGELDCALAGFDHPALHRSFHWDVARASAVIHEHLDEIAAPAGRQLVKRLLAHFEAHTAPRLNHLRHGIIHGDANDYNILVGGGPEGNTGDGPDLFAAYQQVTGILDFGDLIYSCVVCEPAIAAAYALLDKPDLLAAVTQVVQGYHAVHPLEEGEIAALWDLVCMRLCMSVCHSAHQRRLHPENEYLSISEQPAWAALDVLAALNPRLAHHALRAACGLPADPNSERVQTYLKRTNPAPVLGVDLETTPVHVLDLSVGSPLVTAAMLVTGDTAAFVDAIFREIYANHAEFGVGRYDEARAIYLGPAFATGADPTGERRTVHLGMDLFAPAGTAVYAPLAGAVHACHDNAARYDYGPVIILRHSTDDGTPFFTLYGHLSRESLHGLEVGRPVHAGEQIATLGAPPINGDWPPHLHLQIITDLLGLDHDFPGVARASQRALWLSLSPDPNVLLRIPADRFPPPAPDPAATLAARTERIGRNLSISYRQPLKIVRGLRQYLYDETGRAFLDCVNNVAHVGHSHPYVVAAGQRQMAVLNTNTRYLHDAIVEYAARLCATLPEPLSVCYFVNSGSEANDLALRLARTYADRQDIITVDVAYHGHTQALIEVSPYKHDGPGGKGRPPYVQKVVMPDPYRGPYVGYGVESGQKFGYHVQQAVEQIQMQDRGVAAFICESLLGCGGQIVFPDGYVDAAFRHVRAAGGLCIADEVQTGFGRVGSHFWGFETQGVVPDIVTMGKPAGNGHPLGVVVTTPEIADRFANGMEYFNTFGGNPVSCAIGLAVLDVIEREGLQENARRVGDSLMARLRGLMARHELIGDVRGLGLYIGVELVLDRETLEPAGEQASYVANRARELGVLISTDGPFHNVLKIKPPIIFGEADADRLVATLERVLQDTVFQKKE